LMRSVKLFFDWFLVFREGFSVLINFLFIQFDQSAFNLF